MQLHFGIHCNRRLTGIRRRIVGPVMAQKHSQISDAASAKDYVTIQRVLDISRGALGFCVQVSFIVSCNHGGSDVSGVFFSFTSK